MTKRLFAYIGLTMLAVYTVAFYFGFSGLCAAGVLAVSLLLYAVIVKKPLVEKPVVLLVAAVTVLSCAAFVVYDNAFKSISREYNRETAEIIAELESDGVKRYGMYNYELKAEEIDGGSVNYRILLHSNSRLSCSYGDKIRANVRLISCEENYYRSRRFLYTAESDGFKLDYKVLSKGGRDIWHIPSYIQNKLSKAVQTVVTGDKGDLCSAMSFGDREQLPGEINSAFSKTGLSFLIVVSGLHMSIIALFLAWILKPLGKTRKGNIIRCVITVLFIITYMLLTGFTASVIRSGIVVIMTTLAFTLSRRADAYNNLGIAAILLTFINPYSVGDIGMLLSFSSVFGIIYFYPRLSRRFAALYNEKLKEFSLEINRTNQFRRKLKFILCKAILYISGLFIKYFFVTISATVASMPAAVLTLGQLNIMAPQTSLILTPLTVPIVCFTFLTALIFYVPLLNFFSYFFGFAADLFSDLMLRVVKLVSSFDYTVMSLDQSTVSSLIAVSAFMALIVLLLRGGKKKLFAVFALSLVLLVVSFTAKLIIHSNTLTMKIIGTGSPSVTISGGGTEAMLSYGGNYSKIQALTRKLRCSCGDIKTMIIPDDNFKTSRFALSLLEEFDVERVMLYHSKKTPIDLRERAEAVGYCRELSCCSSIKLELGQGVSDTIINDGKSTWQYVQSGNISVLIVPDRADADRLDKSFRSADYIVCGAYIKNFDLLGYHNTRFITCYDLDEDLNIVLK